MTDVLTQVLDAETAGEAKRKSAAEADWKKLVREIAVNNPDAIARSYSVRVAAEKTTDDLAAAVNVIRGRIAQAAKLKSATGLAEQRETATRELAKLNAAFAKVKDKFDSESGAHAHTLHVVAKAQAEAEQARQDLIHSCPDESLNAKVTQLFIRESALHDRKMSVLAAFDKAGGIGAMAILAQAPPTDPDDATDFAKRCAELRAIDEMSKAIEKELAEVRTEQAELIQRQILA